MASGVGPGFAASEHGPCLVGGTVRLDDVSFTTKKIAIHGGGDTVADGSRPFHVYCDGCIDGLAPPSNKSRRTAS